MSDLEQRLADALTEGAQGAPSATGLAAAARSRARTAPPDPARRCRRGGGARASAYPPRCVGHRRARTPTPQAVSRTIRTLTTVGRRPDGLPLRELARRQRPGARHVGVRQPGPVVRDGGEPGRARSSSGRAGCRHWSLWPERVRPTACASRRSTTPTTSSGRWSSRPATRWPPEHLRRRPRPRRGAGRGGACRTRPWRPQILDSVQVNRPTGPQRLPGRLPARIPSHPTDAMAVCRYDAPGSSSRASC